MIISLSEPSCTRQSAFARQNDVPAPYSRICHAGASHQQSDTGGAPLANGVSGTNGTDRSTDDGGSSEASQEQQQQQTPAKRKKPKPPKAKKPTPASAAAALKLDAVTSVSILCS